MSFRISLLLYFLLAFSQIVAANPIPENRRPKTEIDSIQISVDYLKTFLDSNSEWYLKDPELEVNLNSLIHYFEDNKIDSVISMMNGYVKNQAVYFYRYPSDFADSLSIKSYIYKEDLSERLKRLDRSIRGSIIKAQIPIPEQLLGNLDGKVKTIQQEDSDWLLENSLVSLPDSLMINDVIPDSVKMSPESFNRLQKLDSLRRDELERARIAYNEKLLRFYIDSVSEDYRNEYISEYSKKIQKEFSDSIRTQNKQLMVSYNDSVLEIVNDSIGRAIRILTNQVQKEPSPVWLYNSGEDSIQIATNNVDHGYSRIFIKNELNDSLGIKVENIGRNSLRLLIDDWVTFSRFEQRQSKSVELSRTNSTNSLQTVAKKYKVVTPWNLGGDGTIGFTQTYLSNWKKGGKSALSTLIVLKGFANYSLRKVKWENSLEIRNGWLDPADDKIQKNDDKFEAISRFGISAFKKWYYSAEIDFQTQLFNGYNYPDRENLISGYLSPAKTMLKLGLDYKPNSDFSLFLSPLTSKTVFIRDTAHIDESKYGVDPGKRSYRNIGMNAELKYKRMISPDITYETKYKMFINYQSPFSAADVDWENNLTIQLNSYVNLKMLIHLIYDDNVTFPTDKIDLEGNTIYKPKWQLKEFLTIGFSYKLNKQISRREKLN